VYFLGADIADEN